MKPTTKSLYVALALAVQVIGLGTLIYRYERVVMVGTEVKFQCSAYDPYDPLRGRYLQMRVVSSCTNVVLATEPKLYEVFDDRLYALIDPKGSTNGLAQVVQVAEKPTGEGLWIKAKRVQIESLLSSGEKGKDESWDAFDERRKKAGRRAIVSFPDQFFVNEKVSLDAEAFLGKNGVTPVAVFRVHDGTCLITGIEVDGKPILDRVREWKATQTVKGGR